MKNALKCLSHFTYHLLTKCIARKRDKRLKIAFHIDLKFQMENALFARSAPAVTCVLKLLRGGIPQAKTTA